MCNYNHCCFCSKIMFKGLWVLWKPALKPPVSVNKKQGSHTLSCCNLLTVTIGTQSDTRIQYSHAIFFLTYCHLHLFTVLCCWSNEIFYQDRRQMCSLLSRLRSQDAQIFLIVRPNWKSKVTSMGRKLVLERKTRSEKWWEKTPSETQRMTQSRQSNSGKKYISIILSTLSRIWK